MTNNDEQKNPATLDDILITLKQNQQILNEINTWIKISGVEKVQSILVKSLDSPEKIIVYHLSDGKTTREINVICGVSISTVSTYWNTWNRLGIMKTISVKGGGERHIKKFDLEDYGIDVPTIAKKDTNQKSSQEQKPKTEQPTTEVKLDAS